MIRFNFLLIFVSALLSSLWASKSRVILCFGASLTEGYTRAGSMFHPYSLALSKALGPDDSILNAGKSGERACEMGDRLEQALGNQSWVFILAGTNDVTGGGSAESIFECLSNLWQKVTIRGSKVLAMTLPEIEGQWYQRQMEENRRALNKRIRTSTREYALLFDLDAAFPQHALNQSLKIEYWSDGIHPTALGYDIIGVQIAGLFLNASVFI